MENLSLLLLLLITLAIPKFRRIYFCDCPHSKEIKINQRLPFFDFIKGLAILVVILIHVCYFYKTFGAIDNVLFVNLMNNISRFAIPLFLICSGLLLNPIKNRRELVDFYKRKIVRIFLPYFLFTLILILIKGESWVTFIYDLISGKAELPYYFFIILLECYLIFPLLSYFKNDPGFLNLVFFASLVCYFIPQSHFIYGIPIFPELIFFFAYGLYCREKFFNYESHKKEFNYWLIVIIFYFLLIFIKLEFYYNTQLFYGLAIFNILFYFKEKILKVAKFTNILVKFGEKSLWIYLIHFQLTYQAFILFTRLNLNDYLTFFLIFISSALISYLAATLLKIAYDFLLKKFFKIKVGFFYARST